MRETSMIYSILPITLWVEYCRKLGFGIRQPHCVQYRGIGTVHDDGQEGGGNGVALADEYVDGHELEQEQEETFDEHTDHVQADD